MVCHGYHNLDSQGARPVSDYQLNWENYWRSNVKSKKRKETIHLLSVSECNELLFNLLTFFSTRGRNVWSWKGKEIYTEGRPRVSFLANLIKIIWAVWSLKIIVASRLSGLFIYSLTGTYFRLKNIYVTVHICYWEVMRQKLKVKTLWKASWLHFITPTESL